MQNPVPPPPQSQVHQWSWFERTFPVGATAIWRQDQHWTPMAGVDIVVPRGVKAEIVRHEPQRYAVARFLRVIPGTSDQRIEAFAREVEALGNMPLDQLDFGLEPSDAVSGIVEPLGDTWGSGGSPYGRHALPRSQRSPLKPNRVRLSVSPPDPGNRRALMTWIDTTFAVGTPVEFKTNEGWGGGSAKGVVTFVDPRERLVYFRMTDVRHLSGHQAEEAMEQLNSLNDGTGFGIPFGDLASDDPLAWPTVDNWLQRQGKPMARYQLPKSQRSWMKPNSTTRSHVDRVVDEVNAMAEDILKVGGRIPGMRLAAQGGRASLSGNKYLRFAQVVFATTGVALAPVAIVNIVRKAARGDEEAEEVVDSLAADARAELSAEYP